MVACFNGHTEVVELLLGAGANAELRNDDGFAAIELARSQGHSEIVRLLENHAVRS